MGKTIPDGVFGFVCSQNAVRTTGNKLKQMNYHQCTASQSLRFARDNPIFKLAASETTAETQSKNNSVAERSEGDTGRETR